MGNHIYIAAASAPPAIYYPEYGLLYNWYAIKDVREISNSGWHVPTLTEMNTLVTYLGGVTGSGAKVKEIGTTYWDADPGSTNSAKLNVRGSGKRAYSVYNFSSINTDSYLATQTDAASIAYYSGRLTSANNDFNVNSHSYEKEGHPIRLLKDSTPLSNGQSGTYTGNDGKVYRTICIGTQEWLADNLCETRFRDGSIIPWYGADPANYFTNAEWAALTTAGCCAYNNTLSNVGPGFSFPT